MTIYEVYPTIYDKQISLIILDVSSRNYVHCKNENLPYKHTVKEINTKEKREKILLNFYDALWISIVKELRVYNIDFETIRTVKTIMYPNVQLNQELLEAIPREEFFNSILMNIPESNRKEVRPFIEDGGFLDFIFDYIDEKNIFLFKNIGVVLFDILVKKNSVVLVISKEGEYVTTNILKIDNNSKDITSQSIDKLVTDYVTEKTFLSIPISNLIWKFFENPSF